MKKTKKEIKEEKKESKGKIKVKRLLKKTPQMVVKINKTKQEPYKPIYFKK